MEAIGRLTEGVAHDFSNLLTIIAGYGRWVLDALPAKGSLRDDMGVVLEAADRAASLVGRLLAFSKRQVLKPRVVDLNAMLSDLARMLRRVLGEPITLVTELSPDLGRVRADPDQIEEAVLNLVLNARDAMPNGGQVVMRTANLLVAKGFKTPPLALEAGDYVTITVADTGIGMDAGTLAHLFEPFFTTKKDGGTGLGLATARDIVRQSGGDISVQSQPFVGTTVTIYLPRTEQRDDQVRHPPQKAGAMSGTETILLVEDNPDVRELIRRLLSGRGYQVVEAASAEGALRAWDENGDRIDLLLSDVVMPGMDGQQLADKLRARRPGLPVVLMTGYGEVLRAAQQSPYQGTGLLRKPFSSGLLLRRVRRALDEPKKTAAHVP